jgi:hypothetical protein
MKRALLSAAALAATLASPAFAVSSYTYTADNDGIGTYPVAATVADFCKLGTVQSTAGTNSSITGSFNTGDANVAVNLQDSNDQAQAWSQSINIDNTICNRGFKVNLSSDGGSLHSNAQAPSGTTDFLQHVAYNVAVSFGGASSVSQPANHLGTSGQSIITGQPSVGTLQLQLNGSAVSGQYLLAGTYSDTLRLTLLPNI